MSPAPKTPDEPELLERANIRGEPLVQWNALRERMQHRVQRLLDRDWHFNETENVRLAPAWPAAKSVLVLAGESGQGKTWQLAALAGPLFARGGIVAAVTASGDANADLRSAANQIWQAPLNHFNEITLEMLMKHYRDCITTNGSPDLTILIDDVTDVFSAKRLVREDWDGWGARLAISTSPAIAAALRHAKQDHVHIVEVANFSFQELDDFLHRRGHEWGRLPDDVRAILRRPILADTFCRIAQPGDWRPTNEYQLFERFWRELRESKEQADHPADASRLVKLASFILSPNASYPWSREQLDAAAVSDDVQVRLERIGWLRRLEFDLVEVAHDRLLNWAVAESLVAQRQSNQMTFAELSSAICGLFEGNTRCAGRFLGYVPMDVLWLVADQRRGLTADLPKLLETMEQTGHSSNYPNAFYEKLLPTLGSRIIPAVLERVRETSQRDFNPFPKFAAHVIAESSSQVTDAAELGRQLIRDDNAAIREVGLRVLAQFPHPDALDDLWRLNTEAFLLSESKQGKGYWIPHKLTFSALKKCVQQNSDWLVHRITTASSSEPVSELAWLVCNLPFEVGHEVWRQTKQTLFQRVHPDKLRCLAGCCGQFCDADETTRLQSWLSEKRDFVASYALTSLAKINPLLAVEGIQHVPQFDLYAARASWLPRLMLACPHELRAELRRLMMNTDDCWRMADCYQGHANLMDRETLDLLLDKLEKLTSSFIATPPPSNQLPLWHPLQLLNEIAFPELLSVIRNRAGTVLEANLTQIASVWLSRASDYFDHEFEYAFQLLLKIGGHGFKTLVSSMLKSPNKHCCLKGIKWSASCGDDEIRQLLREVLNRTDTWGGGPALLQLEAEVALAALEDFEGMTSGVLKWEPVLNKLMDVRSEQRPLTDAELAPALAALDSDDGEFVAKGMWVVALSKRDDLAEMVRKRLQRDGIKNRLALAAAVALERLDAKNPANVDQLECLLESGEAAFAAHLALLRNGSPKALDVLERWLTSQGTIPGRADTDIVAYNLARIPERRRAVAEIVWRQVQSNKIHFPFHGLLECLGEIDRPEVREFLLSEIYAGETGWHVVGQRATAIRGLAQLDQEAAFHAAELALVHANKDRELIPELLMDIDEDRAIPLLCRAAIDEPSTLALWAIGRSLRWAKNSELSQAQILDILQSEDSGDQRAGASLAGWQCDADFTSALRSLHTHSPDQAVRNAAETALCQQQTEAQVAVLLTELANADGLQKWSLLEAVIQVADPELLSSREDPLWIGAALGHAPVMMRLHAGEEIESRIKEMATEAEKLDKKRRDD